jgi:hypothetical protein
MIKDHRGIFLITLKGQVHSGFTAKKNIRLILIDYD